MFKFFFGLLFSITIPISGQSVVLSDTSDEIPVGLNSYTFQDQSNLYSEKNILSPIFQRNFLKTTSAIPNFGYGRASIWLKIPFQNRSYKHWYFELDNPRVNRVLFLLYKNNTFIKKICTGDSEPFNSYLFKDRNTFFDLENLENDNSYTLYIQAKSTEDLKFPMTFWEEKRLYQHLSNRNLIWGIYFGFIILISLYNFFLWLTIRDKTYLFYVYYVLTFGLLQADLYGYGFQFLWSNNIINDRGVIVFMFGSNFFMVHFLRNFWDLKKNLSYWYNFSLKISWFSAFLTVVSLFFYDWYFNIIGVILIMILVLWFFFLALKLAYKKQKSAYFSLLAFTALMLATFVVILKNFGILSAENQDYYLMGGSMIEMVLFSLALGDKFRYEHSERERQQHLRNEIAINLHDDLAASLSSLTMYSESNRRKSQKELSPNELVFSRISEKSREALNLVRENVWEMNPRNDASEEWLDRMIKFATETLESKQIELDLQISDAVRNLILPIDYRRDLYLFFKEAINNIAKHSEAELAKIEMNFHHKTFSIKLKDNGKGFNIDETNDGNGLLNFEIRANHLKGKLEIKSAIGEGTELRLSFKISP